MTKEIYLRLFQAFIGNHAFGDVFKTAEVVYNGNAKGKELRKLGLSYDPGEQDRYSPIAHLLGSNTASHFDGIILKKLSVLLRSWEETLSLFLNFVEKEMEKRGNMDALEDLLLKEALPNDYNVFVDPTSKPRDLDYDYDAFTSRYGSSWAVGSTTTYSGYIDTSSKNSIMDALSTYVDTQTNENTELKE